MFIRYLRYGINNPRGSHADVNYFKIYVTFKIYDAETIQIIVPATYSIIEMKNSTNAISEITNNVRTNFELNTLNTSSAKY